MRVHDVRATAARLPLLTWLALVPAAAQERDVTTGAEGVSLWLVPERECAAGFAAIIDQLSEAWATPRFAPHVTLLSGVRDDEAAAVARARQLPARLGSAELRFGSIGWRAEYYRAFYVEVERTPALARAHALAAAAYGRTPDPGYFPHLSLAYGEVDELLKERERRRLAEELGGCRVERLDVVRTDGPVASWVVLERLPLR